MVMQPILVRRGDTLPLQYQILDYVVDSNGVWNLEPVDLTGKSVLFNMILDGSSEYTVEDGSCSIIDITTGIIEYEFASIETATNGMYKMAVEVVDINGKTSTYPKYDQQWIHIFDDTV